MKQTGGISYDSLYNRCRVFYESLADHRALNASIKLVDFFMSAMAMFELKYPSLLTLNVGRTKKEESNLKQLFGIRVIPSDTAMRETLDEVSPSQVQPLYGQIVDELESSGKLKHYEVLVLPALNTGT